MWSVSGRVWGKTQRNYNALSYAQSHRPVFVFLALVYSACLAHLPTDTWIILSRTVALCSIKYRLNGLLNLSIFQAIYGQPQRMNVMRTAVEIATVRVLQWWCASPTSSRQLVAVKPPGAVHGSGENKSIKARALLLAPLVRGGAELWRGRHHVYLIQLGSLWGLPWEQAAKKRAAGLSNKDIQPTPLPRMNPPH